MEDDQLESFKILFSHVGYPKNCIDIVYLMLESARSDRFEFVEHILVSREYHLYDIIFKIIDIMDSYVYPFAGVALLQWLIGRDTKLAERETEIYHVALVSILENNNLSEQVHMKYARILIGLGAFVTA
jgi:hypothetical protein